MPLPLIAYAAAFVGGQLGGVALGTAIVKKVLPSNSCSSNTPNIGMLDGNIVDTMNLIFNQK